MLEDDQEQKFADLASGLPGASLVFQGLVDLKANRESLESLLVAAGSPRLHQLGVPMPPPELLPLDAEMQLYRILYDETPKRAHARYNALIRELVSFERALAFRRRHMP